MPFFELTLIDSRDGACHQDLLVRVGHTVFVCDSYYLLIDRSEEDEDRPKVRRVLARLLGQWIAAVETMADRSTAFLPFDFSDQHTRWLRIERQGDDVTITAGASVIEGWSFSPSDISNHVRGVPDWNQESGQHTMPRADFVEDLRFILERETTS